MRRLLASVGRRKLAGLDIGRAATTADQTLPSGSCFSPATCGSTNLCRPAAEEGGVGVSAPGSKLGRFRRPLSSRDFLVRVSCRLLPPVGPALPGIAG